VWQRIHETLLTEMRRRYLLDMSCASVDSSSLRAVMAGKNRSKPDRVAQAWQ
jgi:hypothetical protein